jgi:hypothetical protein
MRVNGSQMFLRWLLLGALLFPSLMWACDGGNKPECEKNNECKAGFFCKSQKCVKLATCTTDVDCENGKKCVSGDCQTVTDTEKSTNDGGTTEQTPENTGVCGTLKPCANFSDCANGETCTAGCCAPTCDAKNPCPGVLKCDVTTGRCVPCLVDADCGTASSLCAATANCSTSLIKRCDKNLCADKPCECGVGEKCDGTSGKCLADKVCPGGEKPDTQGNCPRPCASAKCQAGQTPDPSNNCQCIPQIAYCQTCTRKEECGIDGLCVTDEKGNKFCAEDCGANRGAQQGQCSDTANYTCFFDGTNKYCKPILGFCPCLGVKCTTAGTKCCANTGACQECCGNQDCQAPKICNNVTYICEDNKCAGKTCPTGQACDPKDGQCKGGSSGPCPQACQPGTCCNTTTLQCTASACASAKCNPACDANTQDCCELFGGQAQCVPKGQCPASTGGGCKADSDCPNAGDKCCDFFGLQKMCIAGSDPTAALLCGGGSGSCVSDADCKDPAASKCCDGLIPGLFPKSCKAKCGGFP